MDKSKMMELIDKENFKGYSQNIDLSGYNFFKGESFMSFKVFNNEGLFVVNIQYLYSDNYKDLLSILSYACNFWNGKQVKFVYYKELEKHPYVVKQLEALGFKVVKDQTQLKPGIEIKQKNWHVIEAYA